MKRNAPRRGRRPKNAAKAEASSTVPYANNALLETSGVPALAGHEDQRWGQSNAGLLYGQLGREEQKQIQRSQRGIAVSQEAWGGSPR